MEKLYQSRGKIPSKSDYQTQIIPIHSKAQKMIVSESFPDDPVALAQVAVEAKRAWQVQFP